MLHKKHVPVTAVVDTSQQMNFMGARRAIFAHMIRAQCTHRALSSPALCVVPGVSNMPYSSEKDRRFVLQSSWLYCGSSRLEHVLASKIKFMGACSAIFVNMIRAQCTNIEHTTVSVSETPAGKRWGHACPDTPRHLQLYVVPGTSNGQHSSEKDRHKCLWQSRSRSWLS